MTNDPHSPLPDEARWLQSIGLVLANLGFELVEPDKTQAEETSHLLVALRPQPTLTHFDPAEVDYWISDGTRGQSAHLDAETKFPLITDYAWGRITITDRLGVKNEFLSFGGALRAQMTSESVVLAEFSSHAPILRRNGHSQASDPLAAEVGAFFARIKVPIDFAPGAEALFAKTAPRTFYCAFVQFVRERLTQAHGMRDANRWLADWSSRESQRLEPGAADHWQAAAELRRQLAAIEAVARE
ncbi:MAG TPA: hypothetical protein VF337_12120 [Candidatus Limnocylindrales bacterium]